MADEIVGRGAGTTLRATAIYPLRGTTCFGFSDVAVGQPIPSAAAVKQKALDTLGRLP